MKAKEILGGGDLLKIDSTTSRTQAPQSNRRRRDEGATGFLCRTFLLLASLILFISPCSAMSFSMVTTRFVLLQTRHKGNVGAAARAIKTMGFDELVLVEPFDAKVLSRQRTKEGASGAVDILHQARVCATLQEAVEGTDIWCGTGMPNDMYRQRPPQDYREPRAWMKEFIEKQNLDTDEKCIRVSFLFGNEKHGILPEDMDQAHVVLGIPTNPDFGSLNLASAVQLIAYDWRQALGGF